MGDCAGVSTGELEAQLALMLMVSIDSAAGVGYVAQMSVGIRLQNDYSTLINDIPSIFNFSPMKTLDYLHSYIAEEQNTNRSDQPIPPDNSPSSLIIRREEARPLVAGSRLDFSPVLR